MSELTPDPAGQRLGRVLAKVARRAAGFVLLTLTVGLTTCSALDAVKMSDASKQIERSVDGEQR